MGWRHSATSLERAGLIRERLWFPVGDASKFQSAREVAYRRYIKDLIPGEPVAHNYGLL